MSKITAVLAATGVGVGGGLFFTHNNVRKNDTSCIEYYNSLQKMQNYYRECIRNLGDQTPVGQGYRRQVDACENEITKLREWKQKNWLYRAWILPPFPNYLGIDNAAAIPPNAPESTNPEETIRGEPTKKDNDFIEHLALRHP